VSCALTLLRYTEKLEVIVIPEETK
jgi:hypothetical protein